MQKLQCVVFLAPLALTGCEHDASHPEDLHSAGNLAKDEDPAPSLIPTDDEIAAVRAEHVVASLRLEYLGTIEFTSESPLSLAADTATISYVIIGSKALLNIVSQLDEQSATPAEVFRTLAPEAAIPARLAAHHAAQSGYGSSREPRLLDYTEFRTLDEESNYCGSGVLYSNFKNKWEDDFAHSGSYAGCDHDFDQITSSGSNYYYTPGATGYALSACNKKVGGDDILVQYHVYHAGSWDYVWMGWISESDAVHYYAVNAGGVNDRRMTVGTGSDCNTFVGWGYGTCAP